MEEKRYYSDSALTPKGNLWIIGGTNGSFQSRITEVYDYQPNSLGNWHKGFPLPDDLLKGGISSQCVVQVNSTSVFMAGGFTVSDAGLDVEFCSRL